MAHPTIKTRMNKRHSLKVGQPDARDQDPSLSQVQNNQKRHKPGQPPGEYNSESDDPRPAPKKKKTQVTQHGKRVQKGGGHDIDHDGEDNQDGDMDESEDLIDFNNLKYKTPAPPSRPSGKENRLTSYQSKNFEYTGSDGEEESSESDLPDVITKSQQRDCQADSDNVGHRRLNGSSNANARALTIKIPSSNITTNGKTHKTSALATAVARQERPVFQVPTNMDADTAQPGTRSKHASRDEPPPNNDHDDQTDIEDMGSVDPYADTEQAVDPRNEGWDIETHLRYPEKGSKLGLNRQKPAVYRVLRGGIANSLVALCFENAFPNVDDRIRMIRDALYKSAKGYNLGKIAHRLTMDSDYVEDMASLIYMRMGIKRHRIKSAATASVAAHYGLGLKRTSLADIDRLLTNDTYIYPVNKETGKPKNNEPYKHPSIVSLLASEFFSSSSSVGVTNRSKFNSSIAEFPDNPEIPAPMVALVATAFFASISEFLVNKEKSGTSDFSANVYTDAYNRHINTLQDIKRYNSLAYHVLMSGLYEECCQSRVASNTLDVISGIDLDNMPTTRSRELSDGN